MLLALVILALFQQALGYTLFQCPIFYTSTNAFDVMIWFDVAVNVSQVQPAALLTVNVTQVEWSPLQWFPWAGGSSGDSEFQSVIVLRVSPLSPIAPENRILMQVPDTFLEAGGGPVVPASNMKAVYPFQPAPIAPTVAELFAPPLHNGVAPWGYPEPMALLVYFNTPTRVQDLYLDDLVLVNAQFNFEGVGVGLAGSRGIAAAEPHGASMVTRIPPLGELHEGSASSGTPDVLVESYDSDNVHFSLPRDLKTFDDDDTSRQGYYISIVPSADTNVYVYLGPNVVYVPGNTAANLTIPFVAPNGTAPATSSIIGPSTHFGEPVDIVVQFNRDVPEFDADFVQVLAGGYMFGPEAGTFQRLSNQSYTRFIMSVWGFEDDDLRINVLLVRVPANASTPQSLNCTLIIPYSPPNVGAATVIAPSVHHGTGTSFLVQASFLLPLADPLTVADVHVALGRATVVVVTVASPTSYIIEIAPVTNDTIGVQVVDRSHGNVPQWAPSNVSSVYYVPAGTPTTNVSTLISGPVVYRFLGVSMLFTFSFSAAVLGFDPHMVIFTPATAVRPAVHFSDVFPAQYTLSVTSLTTLDFNVSIAAGMIAHPYNSAAEVFSVTFEAPTPTPTPFPTPSQSFSQSRTTSRSSTPSVPPSATRSRSRCPSSTASPSRSPSDSPSTTPSHSDTASISDSWSFTATTSLTISFTPTTSLSTSLTATLSVSPSVTASAAASLSGAPSPLPTNLCTGVLCSLHGECIPATGACVCSPGYISVDCSVRERGQGHCFNGVRDEGESDTDCGGPCNTCWQGMLCARASDCVALSTCTSAGVCTANSVVGVGSFVRAFLQFSMPAAAFLAPELQSALVSAVLSISSEALDPLRVSGTSRMAVKRRALTSTRIRLVTSPFQAAILRIESLSLSPVEACTVVVQVSPLTEQEVVRLQPALEAAVLSGDLRDRMFLLLLGFGNQTISLLGSSVGVLSDTPLQPIVPAPAGSRASVPVIVGAVVCGAAVIAAVLLWVYCRRSRLSPVPEVSAEIELKQHDPTVPSDRVVMNPMSVVSIPAPAPAPAAASASSVSQQVHVPGAVVEPEVPRWSLATLGGTAPPAMEPAQRTLFVPQHSRFRPPVE